MPQGVLKLLPRDLAPHHPHLAAVLLSMGNVVAKDGPERPAVLKELAPQPISGTLSVSTRLTCVYTWRIRTHL